MCAIIMKGDYMYRQTYAKIDMDSIYRNIIKIREHYDYEHYIGVIKDNCYGHGIGAIRAIIDAGCTYLAVATLEEAIQVRLYTDIPVLCLGYIASENLHICVNNDIAITIHSLDYFNEIKDFDFSLRVHLKLNTGMNRLGIKTRDDLDLIYNSLKSTSYTVEGIFSHIYNPDNRDDTNRQFDEFYNLCKNIDLSTIPMVHIAASDALTKYPKLEYINGVRLGLIMYGFSNDMKLESTFSVHSKVIQINELDKNEKLGYNGAYVSKEKEKIAVIQIGYADGIIRAYEGNDVYINNKPYKIIGNVCMDMLFTKADDSVKLYDEVTLLKDNSHILQTSKHLNTIPYEILCGISSRVTRVYEYNGETQE